MSYEYPAWRPWNWRPSPTLSAKDKAEVLAGRKVLVDLEWKPKSRLR